MDQEKNQKILSFLRDQIDVAPDVLRGYVVDGVSGESYPHRNLFVQLRQHARGFLSGNTYNRLMILSGLRGSGKTTLFAQLFFDLADVSVNRKLFISLDKVRALGVSLIDALAVYEKEILNCFFEKLDSPVFLFLDEVQYDDNWALVLKTIYDRTHNNKVCIFATGSAALKLQYGRAAADIEGRRAQYEHLFPVSFTEYLKIKNGKFEEKGLAGDIRKVFTQSANADEFFTGMASLVPRAKRYWSDVNSLEVMRYLKYGSLPFVVSEKDLQKIHQRTYRVIERIIRGDIVTLGGFEVRTIAKIPEMLYVIAHSDIVSTDTLARNIGLSRPVVVDILRSMEKSEVLLRIPPSGSVSGRVRKPSRYTFWASSARAALFHTFGSTLSEEVNKGKFLEDVAALYLHRVFVSQNRWNLFYDPSANASDFMVTGGDRAIVFEVGFGGKDGKQVYKTMERINKKAFGVVVSSGDLRIDDTKKVAYVPIEMFLLM